MGQVEGRSAQRVDATAGERDRFPAAPDADAEQPQGT
jgi:hypothetical protein